MPAITGISTEIGLASWTGVTTTVSGASVELIGEGAEVIAFVDIEALKAAEAVLVAVSELKDEDEEEPEPKLLESDNSSVLALSDCSTMTSFRKSASGPFTTQS